MNSSDDRGTRLRRLEGLRAHAILVTGVPRSGTTWLARQLAGARHAGLPGREPMNPRGNQFALGGTLTGWTRLEEPTPRQTRILRRCFQGREVRTFSRYGVDQWVAALPWSHTIVKDPFALMSVPAIVRCTQALPVVLYRQPGAVLASYRRMGWTADTQEIRSLQGRPVGPAPVDDAAAMIEFWNALHREVLGWLDSVPGALLVSHAEASLGGPSAMAALMRACGLRRRESTPPEPPAAEEPAAPASGQLHGFARTPSEVAEGWRTRLTPNETARVDQETAETWEALELRRLRLT